MKIRFISLLAIASLFIAPVTLGNENDNAVSELEALVDNINNTKNTQPSNTKEPNTQTSPGIYKSNIKIQSRHETIKKYSDNNNLLIPPTCEIFKESQFPQGTLYHFDELCTLLENAKKDEIIKPKNSWVYGKFHIIVDQKDKAAGKQCVNFLYGLEYQPKVETGTPLDLLGPTWYEICREKPIMLQIEVPYYLPATIDKTVYGGSKANPLELLKVYRTGRQIIAIARIRGGIYYKGKTYPLNNPDSEIKRTAKKPGEKADGKRVN